MNSITSYANHAGAQLVCPREPSLHGLEIMYKKCMTASEEFAEARKCINRHVASLRIDLGNYHLFALSDGKRYDENEITDHPLPNSYVLFIIA